MSLRVPDVPPLLIIRDGATITNSARIGTPVMGRGQWREIAEVQNWLLGGGSAPLAWWGPRNVSASSSTIFRSYIWPRKQSYARFWSICLIGPGASGTFEMDDDTLKSWTVPATATGIHTVQFYDLVTSTTPGGSSIEHELVVNAGAAVKIRGVTLTEIPIRRVGKLLADGLGVHQNSLSKGHPILERDEGAPLTDEQYSAAGVMTAALSLTTGAQALRRTKIFDWQHPLSGLTRSSSTFAAIHQLAPTCQTRQFVQGGTARSMTWAAYAEASASAGEIRVTSSIDASATTLAVNSATPAWYTGTINVATDDMTVSDGWIRGARETLTFEHRATSGNIITHALSVGEQ